MVMLPGVMVDWTITMARPLKAARLAPLSDFMGAGVAIADADDRASGDVKGDLVVGDGHEAPPERRTRAFRSVRALGNRTLAHIAAKPRFFCHARHAFQAALLLSQRASQHHGSFQKPFAIHLDQ